ncbi:hypothetical protein C8R44DRAFT_927162 [Mycena epipterygia]|nr:hypothetical protein C8R44DRAFT_927162 [Mycena epipterygia]
MASLSPAAPAPTTPTTNPAADLPDRFLVESAALRAVVSAHTPICFTPAGEPYIPLPAPFERFYLDPMRHWDTSHDNDIPVARTLVGPPFPLPVSTSQRWLAKERAEITALFAMYAEGTFRPAGSSPFSILREIRDDGSEVYVRQVTLCGVKRLYPADEGWEDWRKDTKLWEIGAALHPYYWSMGLASAGVKLIFEDWAIGDGLHRVRAECLVSNTGSVRLWQKNGFVEEPALRNTITVIDAKGGGEELRWVLMWKLGGH